MKRFLYELSESWKIAVAQMRSNMTRSSLTALGVIIGIVAVTLMGTAIGEFKSGSTRAWPSSAMTFSTSDNGRGKMWTTGGITATARRSRPNTRRRLTA
jgi:hypothetical protein